MSQPETKYRALRRFEYACWAGALFTGVWFLLSIVSAVGFQASQAKRLDTLEHQQTKATLVHGDPFGKIMIPRLGLSAMISEGVDERTLRHAVGHVPESGVPADGGTVVLAAHRDTFFRGLARVHPNDLILLETPRGTFEYKISRTEIVGAEHIELLQSSPDSDLTLLTCFPFHYIGPAPQRFVVQAHRVSSRLNGERGSSR